MPGHLRAIEERQQLLRSLYDSLAIGITRIRYCEAAATFTLRQTRAGYRELHENVEPWQHLVERLADSVRALTT